MVEKDTNETAAMNAEILELSAGPGTLSTLAISQSPAFYMHERHSKSMLLAGHLPDSTNYN